MASTRQLSTNNRRLAFWRNQVGTDLVTATDIATEYARLNDGRWPDASPLFGLPAGSVAWPWRLNADHELVCHPQDWAALTHELDRDPTEDGTEDGSGTDEDYG